MNRNKLIEEVFEDFHVIKQKVFISHLKPAPDTLSSSQWMALAVIWRNWPAAVNKISEKLGTSSSAATQLVNELVRKGYVIRKVNAGDKRVSSLELSLKAKKLFTKMKRKQLGYIIKAFSVLDDKELEDFAGLNKKIIKNII